MIVLSVPALATTGQVTVPLSVFQNLVPPAPVVVAGEAQPIGRSVVGRIDRGVFVGSVRTTFEVLGDTPVEVGVARDGVPLVSVTLDGRPVTVGAVDGWTTVRAGPG